MSISMSDVPFKERVNAALQNPDRLRAISSGAEAAFVKRNIVLESLPDPDATRDLARQIRAHVSTRQRPIPSHRYANRSPDQGRRPAPYGPTCECRG